MCVCEAWFPVLLYLVTCFSEFTLHLWLPSFPLACCLDLGTSQACLPVSLLPISLSLSSSSSQSSCAEFWEPGPVLGNKSFTAVCEILRCCQMSFVRCFCSPSPPPRRKCHLPCESKACGGCSFAHIVCYHMLILTVTMQWYSVSGQSPQPFCTQMAAALLWWAQRSWSQCSYGQGSLVPS